MTIAIRPAVEEDATWMVSLLREGARKGHFRPSVWEQAQFIVGNLLVFRALTMEKNRYGRKDVCTIHGDIWVADWNDKPAAFLICMDDQEGYELHLAGTRSEYLRRGCFKALARHAIADAPSSGRVFVRCYRTSTVAIESLKALGFVPTSGGDPIEMELKRATSVTPIAEPVQLSWWRRFRERNKRTD